MSLVEELKRRKVFKVGAAYLVVAWLAVQAASIGFPAFDAPPWALRIFILVALLGFPVALVLAWVFDQTPSGVVADTSTRGNRFVFAAAALLAVLAIGWYFYGQPSFRKGDTTTPTVSAAAPDKSIAVLPFSDLSPGKDQEYFSDGMAEEILNALAKVKDLKVAGRTSSFSFKGKNGDLRVIGKALGVANVLEGSVRKQGDKVRITAQLIRTDNDFHVWSETYDGDLSDVFALQERIARAITGKLAVVLNGDPAKPLVAVATTNPEAYALYLQASGIFNRREGTRFPEAVAELEQALKLDPKFARAHARLAAIHSLEPVYVPESFEASQAAVEREAALASALDPTLAEPYAALGVSYGQSNRFADAYAAMEHARALDPDDITAAFWSSVEAINTGYTARGIAQLDRVLTLDPLLPNALLWRGIQYAHAGDIDHAELLLRRAADVGLAHVGVGMHMVLAARGRIDEAITQLATGLRVLGNGLPAAAYDTIARGVYGDAGARTQALSAIDAYLATTRNSIAGTAPYALLLLGENRKAIALFAERGSSNHALFFHFFWSPEGRAARALPEFKSVAKSSGLTALWDLHGAPDVCRRVAPGDYACD
jgi:TolB-like protein